MCIRDRPYIDRDGFDLTQYFDGQVDGWKIMGPNDAEPTIYALPFLGDTRYICYDKTIFDQWGVEYLSEHPTVEEILEKAKACRLYTSYLRGTPMSTVGTPALDTWVTSASV